VAVLLVLAYHGFPNVVPGGYVGVDVFFVISGYLITGILLEPAGRFSFADFYRRRVRRLFPALVIVLTAVGVMGWFLLSPPELAQLAKHSAGSAAFVPNFMFWSESGYFDTAAELKPLRHLWSLGVEEQFYLVWPLTLYLLIRFRRSITTVVLIASSVSFLVCVIVVSFDTPAAFYSPLTRAWELGLGALLMTARLESKGVRLRGIVETNSSLVGGLGVALVAGSAFALTATSTFPGWSALLPTVGAALVIAAGSQALPNRLLSLSGFVAIGLISYPLYLWHWPLISFAYIDADGTPAAATRLGALALAFGLAALTYRYVEKPIRRRRTSSRPVYVLVGLMLLIGVAGLATNSAGGFQNRLPVAIQTVLGYASYDYATDARAKRCWLASSSPFSDYARECYLKPGADRDHDVLVWGDSHAARLYPGLRLVLRAKADIAQFTRDGCPAHRNEGHTNCQKSNARILGLVRRDPPRTVILFAVWESYGDWSPGSTNDVLMRRTLDDLRGAGVANIVLVGPAPLWRAPLPTLVYEHWKRRTASNAVPARLASGLDVSAGKVDAELRALARSRHVRFFSLLDLLCNHEGCLTYRPGSPGKLFTWDQAHLTTDGAAFVADRMVKDDVIPSTTR
jgi:peptidoglycan/LPS O-acetylase OafA/YrhL